MANTEAPNTLLSTATFEILDLLGDGPHYRFALKSGEFGADPLCSTYFDDVVVRNLDGSYNFNVSGEGFQFDYLLGTSIQTGITGFQKVENLIPLSSNTRVANPPVGGGPWKPVIASFNSSIYPDADSLKLTMRVPALYAQDPNGNTNPFSLFYEVDIAFNNGPWVAQFPIGHTDGDGNPSTVVEILGKCTSAYQQTMLFKLPKTEPPASFYDWKVRVRRTDVNILKVTTANELFVDSMAVVSSNLYAYPNSVLVGVKISADQFATVPSRTYEMEGLMVPIPSGYQPTQYPVTGGIVPAVYPAVWYGSFTGGAWTDNPAWIYYDLLTNPVHGLGNTIPSGSVDKWSLYDISQFCDQLVDDGAGGVEPNFTCNVVIQQPDQAYSVLLNLASTFRGMLYYSNGTIHATQTENKTPNFAFTNANVIGGQFSYADTAQNTRSTVALVKWVDPQNGYRENVVYAEDPDGILRYGHQAKQLTAFACTSVGQATRLANWTLQTERLLTETISFQTDLEGLSIKPGDAFGVYDNFRNNRSQGGRIVGISPGRSLITLDRPVTISTGIIYSLSAIVPKFTLDSTQLTGSDQIPYLDQSQVETFRVITPPVNPTNQLLVSGMYSADLFIGSPWVLDASGQNNLFQDASFYTCLATSEVSPGKIEILGLQANTGIQFVIQTGYSTESYPPNAGDSSPIAPPSHLTIASITGQTTDNVFYSSLRATWVDSPSVNLSFYVLSGKAFDEPYQSFNVFSTGMDWERGGTGQYLFRLCAVSLGGVQSTFVTGGILINNANPLGSLRGLSGIQIVNDYDPLYTTTSGYTGFIGRQPTFEWNVVADSDGVPIVDYDFISGYRLNLKSPDGVTTYTNSPIFIEGVGSNQWTPPDSAFFSTGLSAGAVRTFGLFVDTVDIYGNIVAGASRSFSNPPMKPPFSSGFVGYNGGINYNVTPSVQYDTSGIYLWCNQNPAFAPTYDNYQYSSENLAGIANIAFNTGVFWTWFMLGDTFSRSGNSIYGPISGNANGGFFASISSIMSTITGGDYVSAQWLTLLSAQTTGSSASIKILANAMVTGAVGGIGGVAKATWGFILDANGKIAGVEATSDSSYDQTFGTLVFTNLRLTSDNYSAASAGWAINTDGTVDFNNITGRGTLQSNTFSPGTAGWQIKANGDAAFNNISARGAFTGGAIGGDIVSINALATTVGTLGAQRTEIVADGGDLSMYSPTNNQTIGVRSSENAGTYAGLISLYSEGGAPKIQLDAYTDGGKIFVGSAGEISLHGDGTSSFGGNATFLGDVYIGNASTTRYLYLDNNSDQIVIGNGGGTVNLYRSASNTLKTDDSFVVGSDCSAATFTTTSARRFKDNIVPLSGALHTVESLRGVRFDWKTRNLKNDFGLIAEDVAQVLPTAVTYNASGDIQGVDYGRMTAVLIEAVKDLSQQMRELRR